MNRITDKPITPQQLKALQTCFSKMNMDDEERHDYIRDFTGGRTESTRELTSNEAFRLLSAINGKSSQKDEGAAKELLKAIYHLSTFISFLNKDYTSDTAEDVEMNKAKINVFCRTRSQFRKNASAMSVDELRILKKQFEAIAYKEKNEPQKIVK